MWPSAASPGCSNNIYPGIALQAIIGTFGVLIGMLVVYKTGAVRVTPRFTKWILGAMVGIIVLLLFNLVMSLFGINTGLRDGGPLAIIFSLVIIGVAAFSLLLDFDQADQAIRGGRPGEVRLVHRLRADDHPGVALHRDPAAAELSAQLVRSCPTARHPSGAGGAGPSSCLGRGRVS